MGQAGANWTEEELVLAFSLCVEHRGETLHQSHPEIIRLSNILKAAPINLSWERDDSYRPVDGVRGRVGNFRRLEEGERSNIPRSAILVWEKYRNNHAALLEKKKQIFEGWNIKNQIAPNGDIPFIEGKLYKRSYLHDMWGGGRQSGISPSAKQGIIFIFSGASGKKYGYEDHWINGLFRYVGEGQSGDMQMQAGNLAIKNHQEDGRCILLFEQSQERGYVIFRGEMYCVGHRFELGLDKHGQERKIIVFDLAPLGDSVHKRGVEELSCEDLSLSELRSIAAQKAKETLHQKEAIRHYYARSSAVKHYALRRADGRCEACGLAAPFQTSSGRPYLEVHHIRRLSDGGPDDPSWVIAVCPNCHRKAHFSMDAKTFNEKLLECVAKMEEELDLFNVEHEPMC